MGFFSKVWKGLKKGVKKIARGIKKVVKKVGKAIGKLGIVGQIGMMFLMPYAMGALGSMFGATGTLSGWSQTLLSHSNIASKALGHTLNLINKAGTFAGKVYNNVSSTISGALDKTGNFLKGRGFVATDPTNLISTIPTDSSIIPTDPSKLAVEASTKTGVVLDTGKALGLPTPAVTPVDSLLAAPKPKGSFLENINIFNKDSAIRQDIANFDAYDYGKKGLEQTTRDAFYGTGKQKLMNELGFEQPEGADYYSFYMPDLMETARSNPAVFDTVDFLANNSGNAYYGNALKNNPYITKLLSDGTSAYDSYMSQFENQLIRG